MKIPPGFSVVTPYIFADNAAPYLEFLKQAFGAEELGRHLRDDGKIANAQLRIGDSMIMMSESQPPAYPANATSYYLYVEDADAAMARALEAGATLEMEAGDKPYGDRQGGVVDPSGNIWWISQRLEDGPYFD